MLKKLNKLFLLCLLFCLSFIPPAFASTQQIRLVVFPFQNLTKNNVDDWIGNGFAETLTASLATVQNLVILERSQLKNVTSEQMFSQTAFVDDKTAVEMGKILSANIVVVGSYQKFNDQISITSRFVDVKTGQVKKDHVANIQGKMDNIFTLQSQLADKIIQSFAVSITPAESTKVSNMINRTKSIAAYENFIKGKESLNQDGVKALEYFTKSVESDPDYAPPYAYLSIYFSNLYNAYLLSYNKKTDDCKAKALNYANMALTLGPDLPETHRALANIYNIEKEFDKATEELKIALKLNPNDSDTIISYIFQDYYKTGKIDYEKMLKELEKNTAVDKDNLQVLSMIGSSYYGALNNDLAKIYALKYAKDQSITEIGLLDEKNENVQKAIFYFNRILQKYPNYYESHLILASIYSLLNKPDMADYHIKQLFITDQSFLSYFSVSSIYAKQKNWAKAENVLKKSIELNPDFLNSYIEIGKVYKEQKKYDEALDSYKKSISHIPSDKTTYLEKIRYEEPYMDIASIYRELENYDEAQKILKAGLEYNPDSVNLRQAKGEVYDSQGKLDEAIKEFYIALDLIDQHPDIAQLQSISKGSLYFRIGLEYLMQNKTEDAISVLKKAMGLMNSLYAYDILLEIYMDKKQYQDIIDISQKVIAMNIANSDVFYNLGNGFLHLNQLDKAETALKKATELQPDYVKAHYNLGVVYWSLGRYKEAADSWRTTLKFDPNHEAAKEWLKKAKEKIK